MLFSSLNLAPLVDEEKSVHVLQQKNKNSVVSKTPPEQTECNTVVMIFIASVLFLALMDSVK